MHPLLPYGIMGANALLAGLLCQTLPETKGMPTAETMDSDEGAEEAYMALQVGILTYARVFYSRSGGGGGGGHSTKFYAGRLRPEVQTLTLLYIIFDRKGTTFVYLPQKFILLSYTFKQLLLNFSPERPLKIFG